MAIVPIWNGDVTKDGRLVLLDMERQRRRHYLRTLAGKSVDIIVRVHRRKRSDKQNKWWFGVAVPLIAEELGYDKHEYEQVHYALVAKCFGTTFDPKLKQEIPHVRSSQLTTVQFSELMEWAVRWAATEYGIQIPLPDEATK